MAQDKTDKTDAPPPATLATTATRETEAKTPEPVGLLGGELDAFAALGLGLGASPRAKELVLKGLMAERLFDLDERLGKLTRGKGRPDKGGVTVDMERAAAVLGADDLLRAKIGQGAATQTAAIELAMQVDKLLVDIGARRNRLFAVSFERLRTSVSKGLGELGEAERFSKK